ncbi:DNA-binding protein RFX2 [Heterocephalus glaber]|uniref:DNA-binding protein RFX2 n=1 Tax=Heterocephalus glaber TaxID=10181 RepID=G5C0P3_HETGA|nr:DNA-binding protein RFX2 [Heterocephalus glaber]
MLFLWPLCRRSMQNSEGGEDSPTSVTLRPPAAAAQPVPPSPQRVLVQVAGPTPKGASMQPLSLPRAPQVPQQVPPVQHVYPAQVQYVEGGDAVYANGAIRAAYAYNPEPPMYAPSSAASYFEAPGGTPVTVAASSPPLVPAHGMVGITMDVAGNPIVSSAGAYLIHGMDSARHSLAHTARSSPATLQWLLDNYETAEGVSLPRSSLYNHYLRHCQDHKLDPVNAASFGKLIRSVFMGLRTRRLGTRGNSKYHYYGIRLKPDSPLNRLQEDTQYMAMRQQPLHQKPRYRPAQKTDGLGDSSLHSTPEQAMATQSQHHQQYIDVSHVFPEFPVPELGSTLLQESVTLRDVKALQLVYRQHCEVTTPAPGGLGGTQFHYIEKLWLSFWNSKATCSDGPTSLPASDEEPEGQAVLPQDKLISLCKCTPILKWMRNCDHILYQALVEILIPDVLRPVPSTLTQAIRNFAKSLEGWLTNAMSDFPQQVIQTKVGVVSAFAQTLRRYTSLNHLAQAARAVLQNASQISQMLSDLNRVDFANVQEQASWVCQCEEGVVQRLEQDFKVTLQQQSSLEQWARWLDGVVSQVLKQHAGSPSFPKAARQFLLKWSFYSSMVIRDLTLRSAASFGSFHLIRLLYDEYMFYLVEHRVAEATGETPIAVMGEEQASWVCQCEEGVVQRLEQDFKVTLQQQSSLEQWARWLDGVVSQVLKQHAGSPSFPKAARQFLLKWSFYSSMVIRDLTLRSAASFGSFHLIRLLYDEYMFYLVEHRVAEATGETPIAVMGEFNDLTSLSLTLLDKDNISSGRGGEDGCSLGEPLVKRERSDSGHHLQGGI